MRPRRRPASHSGLLTAVLVFAVVALVVNVPTPARASPAARASPSVTDPASYTVTWNGVDVSTASSASSALSITLDQSASINYSWSTPVTISDARLQMFYFGYAVSTRDQIVTNPPTNSPGHIPLDWTPVSVAYLLEGVYKLTASFIAPNGTTMWSENFYVRGTAPLGVLAILPIVLLLIVVYEIYGLVRSGRYVELGRKTGGPPPPSPPPSSPPPATPPGETETAAPVEPPAGSSPPSGGSS